MTGIGISISALAVALCALGRAWRDHVTMRRETASLELRLQRLQKTLRRRGDLANEIAHEIKNPLTAILCSAETLDLLLGKSMQPEHRQSLVYIKEYGENLLRLVSDFLDVSRAESGHLNCCREKSELGKIAESVIGLLHASAIKKSLDLRFVGAPEAVFCSVDPRQVKQIVFNLVHNAIKFTPGEGRVVVSVDLLSSGDKARIMVQDSGPGIPAQECQRLFELYTRYESEETKHNVGVGLGLALTKTLTELNGGEIYVDSTVGVGTSFSVVFPLVAAPREIATPEPRIRGGAQPLVGQTFLIVDEDSGARQAMCKLIEAWGGMVDGVSQAADAVRALQVKEYDAVMLDGTASGKDTAAVVQRLREESKDKGTTFIVTGPKEAAAAVHEAAQADKYVQKPLNGRLLLRSLVNSGKYHITH
ncbi:MAG: response regulator [Oligoflexia bacterium]|nr:response regulator [Oligoflexia bacterium]